jgi:hypothetical protein
MLLAQIKYCGTHISSTLSFPSSSPVPTLSRLLLPLSLSPPAFSMGGASGGRLVGAAPSGANPERPAGASARAVVGHRLVPDGADLRSAPV